MSEIFIENESSTEANVRVKFYSNDQERVSSGSSGVLRFVNESGVRGVQVEAKSRKQWDDCTVLMNVGETLVVFDDVERIGCRVK